MVFEEPKVEFIHFEPNEIITDSWVCPTGPTANDEPGGAAIRICNGEAFDGECNPYNAGDL